MDNLLVSTAPMLSGFRLDKLELYNWGTFDSSRGHVHTVRPEGATTLLIGQNGSGKSTLVDAILTLLVRPRVRNYNVAAGAQKQERDERTYIKGAYGRFSRDDDNRAEVQFLRGDGKQYSAILACFRNDQGDVFSVAQVLYLGRDGTPADKVYCVASQEMSIAEHCAKLQVADRVRQQLEKRGFRATTSYTEYFSWFQRLTGVKPKAMDMFNQTVAVKDIQSLNRFIREHMLESKPWRKKIEDLQMHFTQLSDAHQSLVRVRKQFTLLGPVVEKGREYTQKAAALAQAERIQAASDAYFRQATIDLFTPACEAKEQELVRLAKVKEEQTETLKQRREEIRRLTNEIEQAGGDRLKQLPLLIDREDALLRSTQNAWSQFCTDLKCLGLPSDIHDADSFSAAVVQLVATEANIAEKLAALDEAKNDKVVQRAKLNEQKTTDTKELESLNQRHGNLPDGLSTIRQRLCDNLRISISDLPFVAELVAVKPDQREWQASIENVLRNFSLSLLVPDRHYAVVSTYVDDTRLIDGRGQGQRLQYVKVGAYQAARNRPAIHQQSLFRKLDFREGHFLLPWVKAELENRFNLRCCETINEFLSTSELALTRQRHIKWNSERHQKDDRERSVDPRNFVLGWDNREKRRVLDEEILRLTGEIKKIDEQIDGFQKAIGKLRSQEVAAERVRQITDFSTVDFASHAREKEALEREKKSLEENNDDIRMLRDRVTEIETECERLDASRDMTVKVEDRTANELEEGRKLIANAEARLASRRADGSLARHQEVFEDIQVSLADQDVTVVTLVTVERDFNAELNAKVSHLRGELTPVTNDLQALMYAYLRQFPDDHADLAAKVEYLTSFEGLHKQIRRDDLPRHENRFKEHMNEKVIHEIGLLNGSFQSERTEIIGKIDLLNQSLRQLAYRPGTFMRLEPRDVRDSAIAEFRTSLLECLAGTFEGTFEADEARYLRIEKFLTRLRDNANWCDKVTDVRNWFDFVARELDAQTERERAYYEDSAGQSGGEKAKLAFTILVAAIAYQYDLDPTRPASDRFRFVVVDEMFSKVDDQYSEYALELFKRFGLQLLIVAPLDSKARVTEPHVGCYLHVVKDAQTNCSEIFSMTAREFDEAVVNTPASSAGTDGVA